MESEEVIVVKVSFIGHKPEAMGTYAFTVPLGEDMEEEQGKAIWRACILAAKEAMSDGAPDILGMLYRKAREADDGEGKG